MIAQTRGARHQLIADILARTTVRSQNELLELLAAEGVEITQATLSRDLVDLAVTLNELVSTARQGKTQPAAMSGGTFTITNIGVFGVDAGTPILNPGEAGILCVGQIARRPWVMGQGADERIEPRWVTTLAVSFDHRLADGAQGSTFLAAVGAILADPGLALLY